MSPLGFGCRNLLGRLAAFVALVLLLPQLVVIGFVMRTNSDEPVLLEDEVLVAGGARVRVHSFRTTGRGTAAFRAIGRVLRSVGWDDLPGLWDVVRGQLGLTQFYDLIRNP